MKVRAIKNGYYGGRYRYAGDVFTLVTVEGVGGPEKQRKRIVLKPEDQFSANWMEKLDSKTPVKKEEVKAPAPPAGIQSGAPTGDQELI